MTSQQVREADAYTIANEPINSIDLMERASIAFVEKFLKLSLALNQVTIVCGPGNNGGDGFAIARLLHQQKIQVQVWMVSTSSKISADCKTNRNRWQEKAGTFKIEQKSQLTDLALEGVVIDALFGSGIAREVSGIFAEVIKFINQSKCQVVAVDMPSGLFSDQPSPGSNIIEADYTLSFQTPKLAFFLPQNRRYVGAWYTVDIGLDTDFLNKSSTNYYSVDAAFLRQFNKDENRFAHKGDFGHALLVAGMEGKIGAAVLAARGAMSGGPGLLTVHIPQCGLPILQTAVPVAMCQPDPDMRLCTDVKVSDGITTIGVGPGIGMDQSTIHGFKKLLAEATGPVVIDADGLNIISQNRECLQIIPGGSILTPHPKELARLVGSWQNDFHRLQIQSDFAERYGVVLVCKGAHTTIATPEGKLFFNTTGNMGMATAGSGDVLTGLITGLLARTRDPLLSAVVGVFIHGLAGDLAAEAKSKSFHDS